MSTNEIVRALRAECVDCSERFICDDGYEPVIYCANRAAANQIESLQALLTADRAKYAELQRYNVDCTKQCDTLLVEKIDLLARLVASQQREKAAVEDIPHECYTCAHRIADEACAIGSKDNCFWQWRGSQQAGEGEAG